MLIPVFGIALCLALWGQWFPPQGPTPPGEPFLRRLGSTLQRGLETWVLAEMVGAVAPRGDALNEELLSHPGIRAVVHLAENPGLYWLGGTDEGVPFSPIVWETSPAWLTPVASAPAVCEWNGSVDFLEMEFTVTPSRPPRGGVFLSLLLCGMFFIIWLLYAGRKVWFAFTRRLLEDFIEVLQWILTFVEGPPRISRVQPVHVDAVGNEALLEESYSEVDRLIERIHQIDDEIDAWTWAIEQHRLQSGSSVSAVSQSDGACVQQVAGSLPDDLPQEVPPELDCNRAEMETPTEDVRMEPVSEPTGMSPDVDVSEPLSPAPAEGETAKDAEAEGRPPSPVTKKKKNRPSMAARRRKFRQAQREGEQGPEKTLP